MGEIILSFSLHRKMKASSQPAWQTVAPEMTSRRCATWAVVTLMVLFPRQLRSVDVRQLVGLALTLVKWLVVFLRRLVSVISAPAVLVRQVNMVLIIVSVSACGSGAEKVVCLVRA